MNLRIHVERAVERINFFFRIIQGVVPVSLYDKMSKKSVCCLCYLLSHAISYSIKVQGSQSTSMSFGSNTICHELF